MKPYIYILPLLLAGGMATSCDGLLDIDPPTESLTADQIYSSAKNIEIAAEGLYTKNFMDNPMYFQELEMNLTLTADEMYIRRDDLGEYHQNNYTPSSSYFPIFWTGPYETIYQTNDFIINVENNPIVKEEKKIIFLSEAKYFRAYSYFMLVNTFGDVPLILGNNPKENAVLPRTSKEKVYEQIVEDLKYAEEGLKGSKNGISRISTAAAKALLARVYLYTGKWKEAKAKANELIPAVHGGTGTGFKLEKIERIFKAVSTESILHINMKDQYGKGERDGFTRLVRYTIPTGNFSNYNLSEMIVKAFTENPKDLRNSWISYVTRGTLRSYFPYKYKNIEKPANPEDAEYMVLLRLTEQYMIRSEANAQLGNLNEALKDLNLIRERAGIDPIESVSSKEEMLLLIEEERRKEFFFEGGHRWFDLNRTGRANAVYSAVEYKTGWTPEKGLLPIPEEEMGKNPFLVQNPGY